MSRPALPAAAARVVDAALEATVVGSFSRLGPAVRRVTDRWEQPHWAAGRTVLVTGATSGIGLAAAGELCRLGARVVVVGRDPARTEAAAGALGATGAGEVAFEVADLGDLEQTAGLARRLAGRLDRLDVLVHNAGALLAERRTSPQGTEATLTVHLLSPYLLTERLRPLLAASAPSRVVTVTSGGMYTQRFDLASLEMGDDGYDGVAAYARAKRAQVVLTAEWQRRYGHEGVDFCAVHPGWADTPGLSAGLPAFRRALRPLLRTAGQGADTVVWLAGSADGSVAGGRLWLDRRPRGVYHLPWTRAPAERRVAEGAALWEWCGERVAGVA